MYLSVWCIWLHVLVMSHMHFRMNPHYSCLHSEMRTWHDKNIQSNAPYKWLSVCLRTEWFWVRVQLQSLQKEYFQNGIQLLVNELKRYILPDDNFKNWKKHLSCLWRQKLKQSILLLSGKLTTLGLFFVENKDWMKAEIE